MAIWIVFDYLSEHAFSLHIWDVGANFVLTNLSSPPDLDYGHLTSAPQNPIYLAFVPLVRLVPDPMTLVYAEDVLMGLGGVILYLVTVEVWQRRSLALLVEGLYLFSYALFGAPFYPNHYEILFSVFFPLGYLFFRQHRPAAATGVFLLAAACSSLAAVTTVLFVVLVLGPRFLGELRGRGLGVARFLWDERYLVATGALSVGIFLVPFALVGVGETLSYAHLAGNPSSPDLAAGASSFIPEKLVYFGFVYLPFFPVIRRSRYALLTLPYVALVLVAGSDHYNRFAYQYTYTIGAVVFLAFIESLRTFYAKCALPYPPNGEPRPRGTAARWRLPTSVRRHRSLAQLTLVSVALGFLALPFSPGNAYAGEYGSLPFHDYHIGALTQVTAYDRALWQMTQEIPLNASVLIEENMPMLTNRAVWYEPGSYNGEPVEYALADPSSNWFVYTPPGFIGPYPTSMMTWVNDLYENRSYGILQEYQGAILFEQYYRGPVSAFARDLTYEPGVAFVGPNATYPGGRSPAVTVTDQTNVSLLFRTEGLIVLPPGSYTMTFLVSTTSAAPGNHATFGLWENGTTPQPVATAELTAGSFSGGSTWSRITVPFSNATYLGGAFFGAYNASWNGSLSLDAVYLNQTAAR